MKINCFKIKILYKKMLEQNSRFNIVYFIYLFIYICKYKIYYDLLCKI